MKKILIASILTAFAAPAFAEQPPQQPQPQPASATERHSESERHVSTSHFVRQAAISDLFEIQAGRLALDMSQNQNIKQFAQEMVNDHQKTTDQLRSIEERRDREREELPKHLDKDYTDKLDRLKEASGVSFDREYLRSEINNHEQAVALFQSYARTGENSELKSWAERTLPVLEKHLQNARTIHVPTVTGEKS